MEELARNYSVLAATLSVLGGHGLVGTLELGSSCSARLGSGLALGISELVEVLGVLKVFVGDSHETHIHDLLATALLTCKSDKVPTVGLQGCESLLVDVHEPVREYAACV